MHHLAEQWLPVLTHAKANFHSVANAEAGSQTAAG
jgi:hypothetical protein